MHIKLMSEYECYPLWCYEDDIPINIDPESLFISDALKNDITKWSEKYEATYVKQNPIEFGFKTQSEERKFIEEGYILESRLQKELGTRYKVSFQM